MIFVIIILINTIIILVDMIAVFILEDVLDVQTYQTSDC